MSASDQQPPTMMVRLDEETIDQLARRVADLLQHGTPNRATPSPTAATERRRLLSAAEVAEWSGIDRSWIYAHAAELGALRLGTGPRPRLRFDPDLVRQRLTPTPHAVPEARPGAPGGPRRSRRITGDRERLLPFRADPELSSPHPDDAPPGRQA